MVLGHVTQHLEYLDGNATSDSNKNGSFKDDDIGVNQGIKLGGDCRPKFSTG